jgi:hypothetical protein
MLERVTWVFPETACLVVLDPDQAPLGGLVWDLGASYVLPAADSRRQLADLVAGFAEPTGVGMTRAGTVEEPPGA